ncbi:hypothetical protein ZWY2020_007200 [Hordeum vulgare]|nr:hypothetical protein ZWY2020_007200 [Hordeum vulgare]
MGVLAKGSESASFICTVNNCSEDGPKACKPLACGDAEPPCAPRDLGEPLPHDRREVQSDKQLTHDVAEQLVEDGALDLPPDGVGVSAQRLRHPRRPPDLALRRAVHRRRALPEEEPYGPSPLPPDATHRRSAGNRRLVYLWHHT